MIYLLDSNAWIHYMRQSDPQLVQNVQRRQRGDVGLCSVVLGELYYGAYRSPATHRAGNFNLVLQLRHLFPSAPFDDDSAEVYGRIRADLAAKGMLIGPYDLMIAAIALAHGLIVVTHNTAEFSRVANLSLEDWQTPSPWVYEGTDGVLVLYNGFTRATRTDNHPRKTALSQAVPAETDYEPLHS